MAYKDTLDKHHTHNVVIIPRFYKGRRYLVKGLYCEDCCKLIQWLKEPIANELIECGVELLPAVKEDKLKLLRQQLAYKEQKKLELRGVV